MIQLILIILAKIQIMGMRLLQILLKFYQQFMLIKIIFQNILNQLKDNKDITYDNNNNIYSRSIYINPGIDKLNPFTDNGKLISETQNLNIENNIESF